jgi:V8-like Glu-specific endopeptidase
VLISKNILLTAAHNIYDKKYNCENSNFKFYVGAFGVTDIFYKAEEWRYPERFKTCSNNMKRLQFDYALIKLSEDKDHPIKYDIFPELNVLC